MRQTYIDKAIGVKYILNNNYANSILYYGISSFYLL